MLMQLMAGSLSLLMLVVDWLVECLPGNGGGGDAVTRLLNLQKERCFIVILHPLKSVVVV